MRLRKKEYTMSEQFKKTRRNFTLWKKLKTVINAERVNFHSVKKLKLCCPLTEKYAGATHIESVEPVQTKNHFIHKMFENFKKYKCHLFFRDQPDSKTGKIDQTVIPKTNEEDAYVTRGSIKLFR